MVTKQLLAKIVFVIIGLVAFGPLAYSESNHGKQTDNVVYDFGHLFMTLLFESVAVDVGLIALLMLNLLPNEWFSQGQQKMRMVSKQLLANIIFVIIGLVAFGPRLYSKLNNVKDTGNVFTDLALETAHDAKMNLLSLAYGRLAMVTGLIALLILNLLPTTWFAQENAQVKSMKTI